MPKIKKCMSSISKRHLQRLAKVEKDRIVNRHVITHMPASTIPSSTCDKIEDNSNNYLIVNSNDLHFPTAESCSSFEPIPTITDNNHVQQFDYSNLSYGSIASTESHDSLFVETSNNAAETDTYSSKNLASELRSWASGANVVQKHLSSLLKILRRHGHEKELPSDARTLVKTPRSVELIEMHPGKYYHFGLCEGLTRSILSNYSLNNIPDKIKINTHIDGLPLSKSSGTQLWPILVSIDDSFYTNPFIVGAYVGNTKPTDSNDFLSYYVEDVKNVSTTGLLINGKKVSVEINLFIGDAPAISYVNCTKAFNARHGCRKCEVEGDFLKNRMTFPNINAPLRTDESFAAKTDEDYHKKTSILEKLNIGMVSAFPSEAQHLVYQGVMKKIMQFAVKGKQGVRMNQTDIELASAHLFTLRKTIPEEFARQPRPLQEVDRYKATEFRQLLLYTGPVIFQGRLDSDKYHHFLSLSVAIRILSSAEFHIQFNDYARQLLEYFVKNYGALYGVEHVTFNVHNLIHLCNDVLRLGPLDNFSSFKYENHLQKLKNQIKSSGKDLQQLVNRTKEQYSHQITENFVHKQYPIIKFNRQIAGEKIFIKSLQYDGYVCTLKKNNNCIYTQDRSIISIQSMYRENQIIYISGKKYIGPIAMFNTPCDSTILNIRVIAENKFSLITLPASEIKQKCVKLSLNDRHKSAVFPLIHGD